MLLFDLVRSQHINFVKAFVIKVARQKEGILTFLAVKSNTFYVYFSV